MEELITTLAGLNISLELRDGNLDLYDPEENLSEELLSAIKDNKAEIVNFLGDVDGVSGFSAIPVTPHKEYYALSSAQERMYVLYSFDVNSVAYNIPQIERYDGTLQKEHLERAFNQLIHRYEILRTEFHVVNDKPMQKILPFVDFVVDVYRSTPDKLAALYAGFIQPFDLDKGPLMRAALVEVSAEEQYLMLDMHHIISDGVSYEIMLRDFTELYAGQSLPLLSLQYKDYAEWQQSESQQSEIALQKDFWLNEFAEEVAVLDLPTDFNRPAIKTFEGATYGFYLDPASTQGLKNLAETTGATLYMICFAAYNVLLNKLSNQQDIVIGTPVAGRKHADLEDMIGLFVNTLPLRSTLRPQDRFIDFLMEVKTKVIACFDHQLFQYEDLVDLLKIARNTSHNPLFDVLFAFESLPPGTGGLPEEGAGFGGPEIAKFDLALTAIDAGERLYFSFEYSTNLYQKDTITRFVTYLKKILTAVAQKPQQKMFAIDVLPANEKQKMLGTFNATEWETAPIKESILAAFQTQVAERPNSIALVSGTMELTYRELEEKTNQLAAYLQDHYQVAVNDLMGIKLERGEEMILAILAILKSGAGYVPIDLTYPEERIAYLEEDANLKGSISKETMLDFANVQSTYSVATKSVAVGPESVAYVIYTSGSTGKPKGVVVPHRAVVRLRKMTTLSLNEHTRILQLSSASFDAATFEIWCSLLNGGTLVLYPDQTIDLQKVNQLIQEQRINTIWFTAALFDQWVHSSVANLKLQYVLAGGDVLNPSSVAQLYHELPDVQIINGYGPTENTTFTCCHLIPRSHDFSKKIPIGAPIWGTSVYILDEDHQLCPQGVIGELCTGGAGLSLGYLNRKALTAEKFIDHPFSNNEKDKLYKTGDLARWLPDGTVEFIGRKDGQVKIRGFRIELGEIVYHLESKADIEAAVVVVKELQPGEKDLVAYVVSKEEQNTVSLRTYLAGRLPEYMLPAYFVQIEAVPITVNGKIDRKALPDLAGAALSNGQAYVAPANETEEQLVGIWADLLQREARQISVDQSFFELGGHSLKAVVLANKIRKSFEVEVPITEIFANQDVRSLSSYIRTSEQATFAKIPKAEEQTYYPLSSAQRQMYFLHALDQESLAYNMPQQNWFAGGLEREKIGQVFRQLIERHEIFRTTFHLIDDRPVQQVAAQMDFEVAYFEASDENIDPIFSKFIRPFDLEKGPLLRAAMVVMPSSEQYLLLDMHHIISDGVSSAIMLRDFQSLYAGQQLPPLALQYKDYASWQQSKEQQAEVDRQKEFWQAQFAELPAVLDLPSDFSRPLIKSYQGNSLNLVIDPQQTEQLKGIAKNNGATLYMLLFATFHVLLSKLSNQKDIVIGAPVAGRQHADLEEMIGFFVNTLPVRNQLQAADRFVDFLERVKEKMLACFNQQALQYEELIDHLQLPRDTSRNPLFDVVFSLENFSEETTNTNPQLTEEDLRTDGGPGVAKFDLTLVAVEMNGQLIFNFEYSTDIYQRESIERMARYFKNIIKAITNAPNLEIATLDIIPTEERKQLLETFIPTPTVYPAEETLISLFRKQVRKTPSHTAIAFDGRIISYQELEDLSNSLAHYLLQHDDLHPEDLINIKLERSDWLVVALLAVLKTGCAYVPIDSAYPEERIAYIQADSNCPVMIDEAFIQAFQQSDFTQSHAPKIDLRPDQLAYVIYTSGSTGAPKGVMIEHQGVVNLCYWHQDTYKVDSSSRGTLFSGIAFDASVWEIYPYLLAGAALYPIAQNEIRYDAEQLTLFLSANKITHAYLPPLICHELSAQGSQLEELKILTGGDVLQLSKPSHLTIYNNYGPTENTVVTTFFDLKKSYNKSIPIGKPVSNTQVYILADDLSLQPLGVIGELCISGVGLARAYWNSPDLTTTKFVAHPFIEGERMYRTGDLARWLPDGNIEFVGRKDHQVKIRGYRIELSEIEQHLMRHAEVEEAVLCALGNNQEKYLVAYYTAASELSSLGLIAHLSETLPEYMLPTYFVQLDRIPLNANGKIDRKALPVPTLTSTEDYQAPADETEEKLVAIWADILQLTPEVISTNKSFFELGGHSLRAVVLANKIWKVFEVKIPIAEIFVHQRIQDLGSYVQQLERAAFSAISPTSEKAYYTASSAQKRMYFLYTLDPESIAYNMPQFEVVGGGLDQKKLTKAFNQLIARHEILRTTFHMVDGQLVQEIAPELNISLAYHTTETKDLETIFTELVYPFDLENGPLIRASIVAHTPEEQYLHFDMHHIISDGVSQNILLRDFMALYNEETLAPLRLQYKDYAEWQQEETQQEAITQQKEFWLKEFSGEINALDLPTDFARPAIKTSAGNSYAFDLDHDTTTRLKALAEETGTTLYMVLLSMYYLFLHKLSNQENIILGTPVAGRQHPDLEEILGLFVNTLALQNQVKGKERFSDFLLRLKKRVLASFENQSFQYEELVNALQIPRDPSHNPLFDVLFSFENFASNDSVETPEERGEDLGPKTAKFDLSLFSMESNGQIQLNFEYATDLYRRDTIKRFAEYFKAIAKQLSHKPDIKIADIDILSEAEKEKLLYAFNSAVGEPLESSILDLFAAQVAEQPEAVALVIGAKEMSYRELDQQSNQLAAYLQTNYEIAGNDLIGIKLKRSEAMMVSTLAILKSGAGYVPIDMTYPEERIAFLEEDGQFKACIDETEWQTFTTQKDQYSLRPVNQQVDAESVAYVIYTSGSTGKPKGVVVPHRGVTRLSKMTTLPLNADTRILQLSSISFDAATFEIWCTLLNGGTLVLYPETKVDLANVNQLIATQAINTIWFTSALFDQWVHSDVASLGLKYVLAGGDVLNPSSVAHLYRQLPEITIINGYGPTENTTFTCCYPVPRNHNFSQKIPIGPPVWGSSVYILDDHHQLCPTGVIGELCTGGLGLAKGYLRRPELTAEKFVPHPFAKGDSEKIYKTGDLARWLPDGSIEFIGRKDGQVKIRGFRIELGEIVYHLENHPAISSAAVIVREMETGEKDLVAYVVAEKAQHSLALRNYLADCMPEYMVPAYYVQIEAIPITVNGKIDRKALPDPLVAGLSSGVAYVAPANETEERLVKIWADLLQRPAEEVSVDRSFFELGGHSLKMMQLMADIKEQFQQELPLVEVFQHPTVRALAEKLSTTQAGIQTQEDGLALLKSATASDGHLFFIHDGSGDVQGYLDLVNLTEGYNCWGLRSDLLDQVGPAHRDLLQIAATYVAKIKKVQPVGPYQIIGWSHGGILGYEMVRQLEEAGEIVDLLVMIDSQFPLRSKETINTTTDSFTLEGEAELIQQFLGFENLGNTSTESITDLWQQALQLFEDQQLDLALLKSKMPADYRSIIPRFATLDLRHIMAYVNTIRSLENAVAHYRPSAPVKAKLLYLKAAATDYQAQLIAPYSEQTLNIQELEGDHFSILQAPVLHELVQIIKQYLKQG